MLAFKRDSPALGTPAPTCCDGSPIQIDCSEGIFRVNILGTNHKKKTANNDSEAVHSARRDGVTRRCLDMLSISPGSRRIIGVYQGGSPTHWKDGGVHGAPGPLAGAGLPFIAVGLGAYWLVRRYRRKPLTASSLDFSSCRRAGSTSRPHSSRPSNGAQ